MGRQATKSTSRSQAGRSAHTTATGRGGGSLAIFDSLCRDILSSQGREILAAGDPLEAELWASELLGMFSRRALIGEPDPADAIGGRLVSVARRRRTPDGQLCLRALAAVASDPLADRARNALKQLGASGTQAPRWLHLIGTAELTSAWRATDLCGDQDSIMIGFRYPDGREHCLLVLIDHVLGGIAKDATVLFAPLERVLAEWQGDPDFELVEEPLVRASSLVMEAVFWTARTIDAPVEDDFLDTVALVEARLGRLAAPIPDQGPLDQEEREALVRAFLADEAGQHYAHDPDAWFLLDVLVDFRCDQLLDPLRWSGGSVVVFLLDWVPRKVSARESVLDRAPEVLRAWVPWAATRAGLPSRLAEETLGVIDEFCAQSAKVVRDQRSWGPAKRIAMSMLADGVDPDEDDAVESWLSRNVR